MTPNTTRQIAMIFFLAVGTTSVLYPALRTKKMSYTLAAVIGAVCLMIGVSLSRP